jgi:hypothetical protein
VALVFLSISMVFIFGCSDESSITEPIEEINPDLTKSLTAENGSFTLPKPIFKSLQKSFSTTRVVKADENTTLRIKKDYESEAGPVKVDAKVMLKRGSVAEDTEVTMTFNAEAGTISFFPGLTLAKDAQFEFRFNYSDLPEIDKDRLEFFYLNKDGDLESAEEESLRLNIYTNEITLENNRLTQLSRFKLFTMQN